MCCNGSQTGQCMAFRFLAPTLDFANLKERNQQDLGEKGEGF